MGPHSTWFEFFPGYSQLVEFLRHYLARDWTWQMFQATHFGIDHILGALLVVGFLTFGAARYAAAVSGSGDAGLVPPPRFGLRNLFEMLTDAIFNLMESVMGEKEARRYLPLVGTLFLFILFSNLLSLIPGFIPPTDTLKTNLGLSVLIFRADSCLRGPGPRNQVLQALSRTLAAAGAPDAAHRDHQPHRPAGFAGHASAREHQRRPRGRAGLLRGDSAPGPGPFLVMGVFVSVVQAVVFSLLSTVYIGTAIAHEEH